MSIEIKVPVLPESVANATVATWYKKTGDSVKRDEHLVDIETDKIMLEVVAIADGVLGSIMHAQGSTVISEQVLGILEVADLVVTSAVMATAPTAVVSTQSPSPAASDMPAPGPSARRTLQEHELSLNDVKGSGKDGRVTKLDVEESLPPPAVSNVVSLATSAVTIAAKFNASGRAQKRVPMSRLRTTIAERLLAAQQNAAILTTFNEINMQPVMDLRSKYKEAFEKKNGVKLGFMSFFVKAVVEALKRFPAINASIDGKDIVYHGFFDIGVAVSSERGLLVPIIRDADQLSMAEIELKIADFGKRAAAGQISIEDMTGGTFTISNGGTFGSLMSTPIINPPQSGILGMHKIEERAVVENKQVVIRAMMYVALSYDHRIVDGAESVRFLVTVKEMLEDPARFLLEV
jgi:2-oxoglutarate dehydrogenase E2 component (dihydrolipoamide succinyltransferase)